jgi:hypothetical protein
LAAAVTNCCTILSIGGELERARAKIAIISQIEKEKKTVVEKGCYAKEG